MIGQNRPDTSAPAVKLINIDVCRITNGQLRLFVTSIDRRETLIFSSSRVRELLKSDRISIRY